MYSEPDSVPYVPGRLYPLMRRPKGLTTTTHLEHTTACQTGHAICCVSLYCALHLTNAYVLPRTWLWPRWPTSLQ